MIKMPKHFDDALWSRETWQRRALDISIGKSPQLPGQASAERARLPFSPDAPIDDSVICPMFPYSYLTELGLVKWTNYLQSVIYSNFDGTFLPYYRFVTVFREHHFAAFEREIRRRRLPKLQNEICFNPVHGTVETFIPHLRLCIGIRLAIKLVIGVGNTLEHLFMCSDFDYLSPLWPSHLTHLKSLEVKEGRTLCGKGAALRHACPRLRSFTVHRWTTPNRRCDHELSTLLLAFSANTFEKLSLQTKRQDRIGGCVFEAINHLNGSLLELELGEINRVEVSLSQHILKPLPRLMSLCLHGCSNAPINEHVVGISQWLIACRSLRNLHLHFFQQQARIVKPFLSHFPNQLQSFSLGYLRGPSPEGIWPALLNQADTLHTFRLWGVDTKDRELQALGSLHNLKCLSALVAAQKWSTSDFITLCHRLPLLERLEFSLGDVEDTVWAAVGQLRKLRHLGMLSQSTPSFQALADFVNGLDAQGNRGMFVELYGEQRPPLTPSERRKLALMIERRVGGTFDTPGSGM